MTSTDIQPGTRVGYTFNGDDYSGTVTMVAPQTVDGETVVWLYIRPDAGQTDSVSAIVSKANVWELDDRPEHTCGEHTEENVATFHALRQAEPGLCWDDVDWSDVDTCGTCADEFAEFEAEMRNRTDA